MGWKNMNVAPINLEATNQFAFEIEENLTSISNGDSIIIPDEIIKIAVTVSFTGGGTGKVQTTTDNIGIVKSGTGITWVDWDSGTVAISTQDSCDPITAIRAVQEHAGTMKMTVRAQ